MKKQVDITPAIYIAVMIVVFLLGSCKTTVPAAKYQPSTWNGLTISDYEKSKEFYARALAPLNIKLIEEVQGWAGFGKNKKPDFWFGVDENIQSPMHIAFSADSREEVNKFFFVSVFPFCKKDTDRPEFIL